MISVRSKQATGLQWLWISGLVIGLDRFSKVWVLENLQAYKPMQILPVFNLTLAFNKGAAFSFLHHANGWQNIFFCVIAFIISVIILIWLSQSKRSEYLSNIALCLILGGAIGNVWDRLLYGYVIDYFDFHLGAWHFAIFNIADSAICVGAALMILNWILKKK